MTKAVSLSLCFLALSACDYDEFSRSLIPEEESNFARDYLHRLRDGDIEYIKRYLDPELLVQVDDQALREISAYFPSGDPLSVDIIGSQVNVTNAVWVGNFTFEYRFPEGWAVANTALRKTGDSTTVIGLNVYRTEASQKELNAFSAASVSATRVAVLVLTFASPLFMLITCYFVYRTPIARRKWLWYVLSFAGIGSFSLNWTSGALSVQILHFSLIGFGASSPGPAAPWVFSFTLPAGAAIFWARRRHLTATPRDTHQAA